MMEQRVDPRRVRSKSIGAPPRPARPPSLKLSTTCVQSPPNPAAVPAPATPQPPVGRPANVGSASAPLLPSQMINEAASGPPALCPDCGTAATATGAQVAPTYSHHSRQHHRKRCTTASGVRSEGNSSGGGSSSESDEDLESQRKQWEAERAALQATVTALQKQVEAQAARERELEEREARLAKQLQLSHTVVATPPTKSPLVESSPSLTPSPKAIPPPRPARRPAQSPVQWQSRESTTAPSPPSALCDRGSQPVSRRRNSVGATLLCSTSLSHFLASRSRRFREAEDILGCGSQRSALNLKLLDSQQQQKQPQQQQTPPMQKPLARSQPLPPPPQQQQSRSPLQLRTQSTAMVPPMPPQPAAAVATQQQSPSGSQRYRNSQRFMKRYSCYVSMDDFHASWQKSASSPVKTFDLNPKTLSPNLLQYYQSLGLTVEETQGTTPYSAKPEKEVKEWTRLWVSTVLRLPADQIDFQLIVSHLYDITILENHVLHRPFKQSLSECERRVLAVHPTATQENADAVMDIVYDTCGTMYDDFMLLYKRLKDIAPEVIQRAIAEVILMHIFDSTIWSCYCEKVTLQQASHQPCTMSLKKIKTSQCC
eukprot:TRINITY_DN2215_c0_g1_i5.p1 TRINITY_DN2215_c0_g1~~TRINITY_DN2215_c0_g1_i5.p1  ORF type:complete len:607 (-),score=130.47 TRINITY_DN2215_c0_g1_i5:163-1956(-)